MLREDKRIVDAVHIAAVAALMAAVYALLYRAMGGREPPLAAFQAYLPTLGILIGLVSAALWNGGLSVIGGGPARLLKDLAAAFLFAVIGYGFLAYTLRIQHLSRLFVYGGLLAGYAASAAWLSAAALLRRRRGAGREARRVVLVGDAPSLARAAATVSSRPELRLEAAGTVDLDEGGLAALTRILDSAVVDYALFAGYRRNPDLTEEAMADCRRRGVEVWFMMDLAPGDLAFSRVDYLEDIPLLVIPAAPRGAAAVLFKRAIDVVLAAALLAALAPVFAVLAVLVRLSGPGPVLFRQRRVGLNGRPFTLFKFRSMRGEQTADDAELLNEMRGPVFKMRADPRVTPLGRVMRKFSLDELPQLWNVLVGEMSLVGPRPPLPGEVERYEVWHRRRLSMRPGITGLWQVMGRNAIPEFNEWVKLDLRYLDGWSLWLDLEIILRTVPVVLRGTGL